MSSSTSSSVFCSLPWLFLLAIFWINAPSCEGVQYLCGNKLSDMLDLVCLGGFGTKTKRSIDPIDFYADIGEEVPLSFDDFEAPFLSRMSANGLTKTRRRRHHGVYDECCRKPCTMAEIRTYCRK